MLGSVFCRTMLAVNNGRLEEGCRLGTYNRLGFVAIGTGNAAFGSPIGVRQGVGGVN